MARFIVGTWVDTNYGRAKVTLTGYRRNSPDVNNLVNLIPSSRISMKNVSFPVFAVDNLGNSGILLPEKEYAFQGDYVIEMPWKIG